MVKLTLNQALSKAELHVQKGEFEDAKKLYQEILNALPNNKRARNKLYKLNETVRPGVDHVTLQNDINHLNFLYKQRQLEEVVKQATIITKNHSEEFLVWNILGAANKGLGRVQAASVAFKKVTVLNPTYAAGFNNLGAAFKEQGKLDEAIASYNKALSLKTDYVEAHYNMGNALQAKGMLDEAVVSFNKALSLKPDYAEAYNNMGNALKEKGMLDEAIASFNKALSLKPDYAEAYCNIAIALHDKGVLDEAISFYDKALLLNTDYVEAYYNLAIALHDKGMLDEAISSFNKALSLKPDYAEAYNNMGIALKEKGMLDEAISSFNKALSFKPDYAEAYNNIGIALHDKGVLDEAVVSFNKALSFKPDYAEAHKNLALSYLLRGNLGKGFFLHEWRMKEGKPPARPPRKEFIWDGKTSVKGKNFLIYEEQGLGDIIQFCRYLPLLEQKGAHVTFKLKSNLHKLLKTMEGDTVLVDQVSGEEQVDFEASLLSLPFLFGTNLKTIPSMQSYLFADQNKVALWANKIPQDTFKIGICWQGSTGRIDRGRSFPLSLFATLSTLPNIQLINLHKGEGQSQIEKINFDLTSFGEGFDAGNDSFLDTAAVMRNCDLIITSDTAVAHLAGALGCNTWVVLKHIPDWRWMLNRSDSPWYPTMTLYRQKNPGNWDSVFEVINRDLRFLLDTKGQ